MLLVRGRCCWFADDVAGWSADDVARAGVGPAERRTIGRSPVSGGRLALRQVAVDGRKGAAPTIRLPLDSVDPPAGPRAPPSVLKDDPVGAAESRPHAAPRGAASPCGDVPHDMFEAPGIGVLGWSGRGCADDWRGRASLQRPGSLTARLVFLCVSGRDEHVPCDMLSSCNDEHVTWDRLISCSDEHRTCRMSHVACRMSHVACRMSHVACRVRAAMNMSHGTCLVRVAMARPEGRRRSGSRRRRPSRPLGANGGVRGPAGGATESSARDIVVQAPMNNSERDVSERRPARRTPDCARLHGRKAGPPPARATSPAHRRRCSVAPRRASSPVLRRAPSCSVVHRRASSPVLRRASSRIVARAPSCIVARAPSGIVGHRRASSLARENRRDQASTR